MQRLSEEREIQISTRHYFMLQKFYILMCVGYQWFCETSVTRGRCALETSWGMSRRERDSFFARNDFWSEGYVLSTSWSAATATNTALEFGTAISMNKCLEMATIIDLQLDLSLS
jgi:hypothetical protein